MRMTSFIAAVLMAAAPAAFAMDMTTADADGDGMISPEEFTATWPDADPALFVAVDVNADGMIDGGEFEAATGEGGLLAG